jgi:hypothetical protein
VIGEPDFTTVNSTNTFLALAIPPRDYFWVNRGDFRIAVPDSDVIEFNLFVDTGNGQAANYVLGQGDFSQQLPQRANPVSPLRDRLLSIPPDMYILAIRTTIG